MAGSGADPALTALRSLAWALRDATGPEGVVTALRDALGDSIPSLSVTVSFEPPEEITAFATVRSADQTLVPLLRYGSQPVGALVAGPVEDDALLLLETAAELAAAHLGQADLQATVLRRSLELALLNDMSRQLNAAEDIASALDIATQGLGDLTGPVELALYQLREGVPALVAWTGPAEVFPATIRLLGRDGETILGAGRATGFQTGPAVIADRPALVHVLRAGQRLVGVLLVRRATDEPPFAEDQMALVQALVEHLAVALHNVEMLAWSRHQAAFDDLTGLASRRHLLAELRREVARVRRQGTPLSMLMIDADHFKSINDTWGHAAGDAVLVALAGALRAGTRTLDVVGRLGGEEFGVLLPSADLPSAQIVAERLRDSISQLEIDHGGTTLRVTVSIGIAEWGPDMSIEDLVELADAALYRSKAGGRNRVSVASALATLDDTAP